MRKSLVALMLISGCAISQKADRFTVGGEAKAELSSFDFLPRVSVGAYLTMEKSHEHGNGVCCTVGSLRSQPRSLL